MTFSELYGKVLFPFIKKFEDAKNEKGRKTVVNKAADAVKKSKDLLENAEDLPKDLPTVRIFSILRVLWLIYDSFLQAIRRHIKGSAKKESSKDVQDDVERPKKAKTTYNARDVIKYNHWEKIDSEIAIKPNSKRYLGAYQRAVTTILAGMEDEEMEEIQNVVDLWNEEGAPSELQLKFVLNISTFRSFLLFWLII